VVIRLENVYSSERDSPLEVTLAQSLLKGEKMDYLIQKATELGIREIVPFFSSRSVPLLDKPKKLRRYHRWEKIAVEASKQCGRGILPEVRPLQDYSEMLRLAPADALRFILWEKQGVSLRQILKQSPEKKKIFFVVGLYAILPLEKVPGSPFDHGSVLGRQGIIMDLGDAQELFAMPDEAHEIVIHAQDAHICPTPSPALGHLSKRMVIHPQESHWPSCLACG
jgi:hypothetical protein